MMNKSSLSQIDEDDTLNTSEEEMHIDLEKFGLLDKSRLVAKVPAYEATHMRHYLTDWEQYKRNQPEIKDHSKLRKNLQIHIKQELDQLTTQERVELTLYSIPELVPVMEDLRKNSLKYNMLVNRLNGKEIEQVLQGNLKLEKQSIFQQSNLQQHSFQIREGLKHDFHCRSMLMEQDIVVNKHLAVQNSLIHQDTQKSASNLSNSRVEKADHQEKDEEGVAVGESGENLDDSATEANQKRLKHMTEVQGKLDEKDKKIKDMQMNRLQSKLRYFIRIEKELRQKIKDVTDKDENLVTILEDAICFGKVLFVIRPVVSQRVASIQQNVMVECDDLYVSRDHGNQESLADLGRQIHDFNQQTKERKQNMQADNQNRTAIVLVKEVRMKQDEYKNQLQQLSQKVDEHAVIRECLKNFVEDEWANLWIKITRNNLFQME